MRTNKSCCGCEGGRKYSDLDPLLASQSGFMGEVYRKTKLGSNAKTIAEEAGHANAMFSHLFIKAIQVLKGKLEYDEAPGTAKDQAFYRANEWVEKDDLLSSHTREHLKNIVNKHKIYEQEEKKKSPKKTLKSVNKTSFSNDSTKYDDIDTIKANSGVYVYSYPLYLSYPISPLDSRTLYKIGASQSGVLRRIERQRRQTEVPEDLKTLRVYLTQNAFEVEEKIHKILTAAHHHHQTLSGGTEWFLTSLGLIDTIAESLELSNDLEIPETENTK